jgi:hypothetical protein
MATHLFVVLWATLKRAGDAHRNRLAPAGDVPAPDRAGAPVVPEPATQRGIGWQLRCVK